MSLQQKKTFSTIFLITTIVLLVLPAITTFNELLTSIFVHFELYKLIQNFIVPIQAKMITIVVRLFGIAASPTTTGVYIGNTRAVGNNVTISWNCIGWQSFILFAITLLTGLQGPYTRLSKLQTIIIGISGTYLINIIRISLVVIIAHFVGRVAGLVFHDYFSTITIVAWLFLFWWFSFSFVLSVKENFQEPPPIRKKLFTR